MNDGWGETKITHPEDDARRDAFALAAMRIAHIDVIKMEREFGRDIYRTESKVQQVAARAYQYADEMMKARAADRKGDFYDAD